MVEAGVVVWTGNISHQLMHVSTQLVGLFCKAEEPLRDEGYSSLGWTLSPTSCPLCLQLHGRGTYLLQGSGFVPEYPPLWPDATPGWWHMSQMSMLFFLSWSILICVGFVTRLWRSRDRGHRRASPAVLEVTWYWSMCWCDLVWPGPFLVHRQLPQVAERTGSFRSLSSWP